MVDACFPAALYHQCHGVRCLSAGRVVAANITDNIFQTIYLEFGSFPKVLVQVDNAVAAVFMIYAAQFLKMHQLI